MSYIWSGLVNESKKRLETDSRSPPQLADILESVRLFSVLKMQGGVEGFPLQLMEERFSEMISAAAVSQITHRSHHAVLKQCG